MDDNQSIDGALNTRHPTLVEVLYDRSLAGTAYPHHEPSEIPRLLLDELARYHLLPHGDQPTLATIFLMQFDGPSEDLESSLTFVRALSYIRSAELPAERRLSEEESR